MIKYYILFLSLLKISDIDFDINFDDFGDEFSNTNN